FPGTLQDVFAQRNAQPFVSISFNFSSPIYREVVDLIKKFNTLNKEIADYNLSPAQLMSNVIDNMFFVMLEEKSWSDANGKPCVFSYKGVHQLVLDTHFFLKLCGNLVSKNANRLANKVCEKSLRIYFSSNKSSGEPMMGRTWYDQRVEKAISNLGKDFVSFGK
ncbi:hypothetical protein BB560_006293, partial [Smittium megazygosporum]